ncbi:MAG TPA: hypothetical protein VLF66_03865, partial [Thermoanaerobaculia bacterium]|nr:hypothetical protein [Thermoanaerobaculia bacterium]
GGAIALEYTSVELDTSLLGALIAASVTTTRPGGAGTVYLKGPGKTYGDLRVDNTGIPGATILPALGAGVAGEGSGGALLVTDRASAIPAYFAGHWVEVYDGATGALKGSARIASVGHNGLSVTLDANVGAEPGDLWQGVYRFDDVTMTGGVTLVSDDPIRMAGDALVTAGVVRTREVRAASLRVAPGATLTHHATSDPAHPESLRIEVAELLVEADGAIDATGVGFAPGSTYPGHGKPGTASGGSHLGQGGVSGNPPGETFGSVYRPLEPGGGGQSSGRGGGVVRIVADRVQVDGEIRADGESSGRAGAGGSVWIRTLALAGTGAITAAGGEPCCGNGAGGGGAIALEYTSVELDTSLLGALSAASVTTTRPGGAGTILLRGPDATYGDLTVDNGGVFGRATVLPSLGAGVAQLGSGGDIVVTDRTAPIPEYFVGHWVRVETPDRVVKGTWRISAVEGPAFALAPNGGEVIDVVEGDEWFGLYRFDSVTVTGGATLQSIDPVEELLSGTVSDFQPIED